jgi:hypothetical protein
MIGYIAPSGRTERIGPWLGSNYRHEHSVQNNLSTATNTNMTMTTLPAFSVAELGPTNYFTMQKRANQSIATATGISYNFGPQFLCGRNVVTGTGGFHACWRFGFAQLGNTAATPLADWRFFCGLRGVVGVAAGTTELTAPTSVNPTTLSQIVGMGKDSADTTFSIMVNGASGTASKLSGANGLTTNTNSAVASTLVSTTTLGIGIAWFQFEIFCKANDTQFGWRLSRTNATGVESVDEGVTTGTQGAAAGIPSDTCLFQPFIWLGNVTAQTHILAYSQFFMEID